MKTSREHVSYPPLFIIKITEKLRGTFLHLYRRFTHPNVALFEMVHHFWLAAALGVAGELGIADLLKDGSRTIGELARLTNTHEESLYRLMRALASHRIFKEGKNNRFALTPLGHALQEENAKYLVTSHLTKLHFKMFSELIHTVRTGEKAAGLFMENSLFEYIGENDQRSDLFNKAMISATMMQISVVLPAYPFNKYKKIYDIGGGQGLLLAAIVKKFPETTGIVYDLPQAMLQTKKVFEQYSVTEKTGIVEGNFFDKIPGGGDLYILKSVLHNWNDESCLKILKNMHDAMSPDAKLLIIDTILDEGNELSFGKMTDILMMVAVGGKERKKSEFESLLHRAGFSIHKIYPTISPHSLIEAIRLEL